MKTHRIAGSRDAFGLIGFLFAVALVHSSGDAHAQCYAEITPEEILLKTNTAYSNALTYHDKGILSINNADNIPEIGNDKQEFNTYYEYPHYFLFKWTNYSNTISLETLKHQLRPDYNALISNDQCVLAIYDYTNVNGIETQKKDNLNAVILQSLGVTYGASGAITSLIIKWKSLSVRSRWASGLSSKS